MKVNGNSTLIVFHNNILDHLCEIPKFTIEAPTEYSSMNRTVHRATENGRCFIPLREMDGDFKIMEYLYGSEGSQKKKTIIRDVVKIKNGQSINIKEDTKILSCYSLNKKEEIRAYSIKNGMFKTIEEGEFILAYEKTEDAFIIKHEAGGDRKIYSIEIKTPLDNGCEIVHRFSQCYFSQGAVECENGKGNFADFLSFSFVDYEAVIYNA